MIGLRLDRLPARIFALVFRDHYWQVLEIHARQPEGVWSPVGKLWGKLSMLLLADPQKEPEVPGVLPGRPVSQRYSDLAYHANQLGAALYPWRFLQTQLESLGVPFSEGELDPEDDYFGQGVWLCRVDRVAHQWRLSPWPLKAKRKARSKRARESSTEVLG